MIQYHLLSLFSLSCLLSFFQKYMTWKKTGEEMNFTYVECLLYTFHHLAHKVVTLPCLKQICDSSCIRCIIELGDVGS